MTRWKRFAVLWWGRHLRPDTTGRKGPLLPGKRLLVCLYSTQELTRILMAKAFKVIAPKTCLRTRIPLQQVVNDFACEYRPPTINMLRTKAFATYAKPLLESWRTVSKPPSRHPDEIAPNHSLAVLGRGWLHLGHHADIRWRVRADNLTSDYFAASILCKGV